jgi:hypothetical protein
MATEGCTLGVFQIASPFILENFAYTGDRKYPLQQKMDFSEQQHKPQQSFYILACLLKSNTRTAENTVKQA